VKGMTKINIVLIKTD